VNARTQVVELVLRVIVAMVLVHVAASAALFAAWVLTLALVAGAVALFVRRRTPIVLGAFAVAVTFGLAQLAAETKAMSCRVRLSNGSDRTCAGHPAPRDGEAVFTTRQRLAVRWANFHMAIGGALVGFPEVARETLELAHRGTEASERARQAEPLVKRRRLCRGGAATGDPLVLESDFAMASANVRRIVRRLAKDTPVGESRSAPHVIRGGYANPDTTWRVALALLVPGAKITVRRTADRVDVEWRGSIQYPAASAVRVPLLFGGPLVLDEAVFCGMQMDGAFVPFEMVWKWSVLD
jgi:hypothetical protein